MTISCLNGICFDRGFEQLKAQATKKSGLKRWGDHPEPGWNAFAQPAYLLALLKYP
jgi:hypothetical protein